ncbi:DNA polymerase III subunit delta [Utexia brackfieldae]|uniref:DNA polymerase III subunit delta n=1 Tax=Utexia brackfieldae TaxID=3074108 RepID=UPI00370D1A8B
MIKINSQQLSFRLKETAKPTSLIRYYLLVGPEPFLSYQAQKQLQHHLNSAGFEQQIIVTIDGQTDWNNIYDHCQSLSLFSDKTLLILQFGDTGLSAAILAHLNELITLLHDDLAIIFVFNKLTKAQENAPWLKAIDAQTLWINCLPPDTRQFPVWLTQEAHHKGINLDKSAIELLCYYYEGNLLALSQLLEQLKLLYPNTVISVNQIENNINDSAIFSPYHWVDAILAGKSKRAIHILQQLKVNDAEPLIMVRIIQKELILLINLKKAMETQPLSLLVNQYKIWQNRRALYTTTLNRLSLNTLFTALHQLVKIEVSLKQDYTAVPWQELETLSLLLLGKTGA